MEINYWGDGAEMVDAPTERYKQVLRLRSCVFYMDNLRISLQDS